MNRFQTIFIGTFAVIITFSLVIYLRVHSTDFLPIFLWQIVVWAPWILYGYLNIILDRRYPVVEQPILFWVIRHNALCFLIIITHIAWFFNVSSNFSPFLGMENTGYGAFFFFFIMWGICDFLFYWALLGISALRQLLSISPLEEQQVKQAPDYFLLKTTGRQSPVRIEDIKWIEAEDYCCRVHTDNQNYLVRQSLRSFEDTLPKSQFTRIHRSTIININFIDQIEKNDNKKYIVRLRNGTERSLSSQGRKKLKELIN